MTSLDREFVVTEGHVRRATRAAFIAWHHTPRPWAKYAGYTLVGSVLAWGFSESMIAVLIPLVVIADAVTFFRRGAEDTRSQEPVGTTIALGFGDDAFVYQTWIRSGEVPYSAVTKVVVERVHRHRRAVGAHLLAAAVRGGASGCALTHDIRYGTRVAMRRLRSPGSAA